MNTLSQEQNLEKEKKHSFFLSLINFILEIVKIVVISLIIVIPVRYFLIQPFYVKGASMEPNFYDYEYLIIDEISYRFNEPRRGEVIVFRNPLNSRQYFIKRTIALPGERIKIAEGEIIIFNQEYPEGKKLDENSYLPFIDVQGTLGQIDMTLKDEEYFVLGDNRNSSLDSRSFGPVNRRDVIGKVWIRGWPFDRFKFFYAPIYDF